MREYTPFGKSHRVLARLEEEPARPGELHRIVDPNASRKKRHRMWRVTEALKEDGMILRDNAGFYAITQAGIDALVCLRAGHPVVVDGPSFRVSYPVAA